MGIEDAYLLFRCVQGVLTLSQQRGTTLVSVQRILQGHFTGVHGGDDTFQLAKCIFKRGRFRAG